ncbi:MAG: lipopolysaccharide transport periplasmic protein LptA [Coxiellaceae bacterium]|nr:lipopolysaccharide transport periplasmic protein LptA [Coxiellaceae bacterium]
MLRIASSLFMLCLLFNSAYALSSDAGKPYHVSSKTVLYDRTRHRTVYTGNVVATQGSTTVTGNRLIILSSPDSNQVELLIAHGDLAHYSTLPNDEKQKLYAQAETIKYWPQQNKVLMVKRGKVTQHHNIFTGSLIWYDIKKQTVLSSSNSRSHTKIVIQPKHINHIKTASS